MRNATIVDGTSAPARSGDLGIDSAAIVSAGGKAGPGQKQVDCACRQEHSFPWPPISTIAFDLETSTLVTYTVNSA